ncbi:LysR family transcriptional regulator [Cohnella terricola]|uniref:LysR family transcriptional regulator n=1 Tax=Cohnella terricola TaxID=1289167 RepID=A0A559JKV4_9BACL|nr:LysR family transcriptional regulator [Cohnella terricola]TVY00513.1 LysR family transcriptional regulator [Cohnella terricola]
MEIRHLQTIIEIVRRNSFTGAAEALHVTQPTISKTIRNLERELNVELFVRDSKTVKLTDAGETILRHAGAILQSFDLLMTELNDLTYLKRGTIRIGLPPMAGSSFFPVVIKRFQERYPGIAIKLEEEGATRIVEGISDGTLDAGVVLPPFDEEKFDSFPLVKERLKLVVPPSHRMAGRQSVNLGELSEERFILFSREFALHGIINRACESMGFSPRIVYESSQWDFIGEMVASDLGISMLPDTICRLLNPDKVRAIELVDPVIPWHLAMVWKREGYHSLAIREWIQFTRAQFAE